MGGGSTLGGGSVMPGWPAKAWHGCGVWSDLVDREARPWRERSPLREQPDPGEDWFLDYPA